MSLKEFLLRQLRLFFILTTLITVAIWVLGSVFDPGASFGYEAMLSPLSFAGVCILPGLVMYSKRELTNREMMIRKGIQLLLIEAVVLGIAFRSPYIASENPRVAAGLALSVLIIYVLANGIQWLQGTMEAKRLTEDLKLLQERARE